MFVYSAMDLLEVVRLTRSIDLTHQLVVERSVYATGIVAGIEFVRLVLRRRLTRLIVLVETVVFLTFLASRLRPPLFTVGVGLGPAPVADMLELALLIPACRRRKPMLWFSCLSCVFLSAMISGHFASTLSASSLIRFTSAACPQCILGPTFLASTLSTLSFSASGFSSSSSSAPFASHASAPA